MDNPQRSILYFYDVCSEAIESYSFKDNHIDLKFYGYVKHN